LREQLSATNGTRRLGAEKSSESEGRLEDFEDFDIAGSFQSAC